MFMSSRLARAIVAAAAAVLMMSAVPARAQVPVRGTIQPEPNKKKMYEGVHEAAVGVEKVVHPGGGEDEAIFPGLKEGTTVAVEEAVRTPGGAVASNARTSTEGVVTRIDRKQKRLIVRFESGKTVELQAFELPPGDTTPAPVVLTYSNGEGGRASLNFKKVS